MTHGLDNAGMEVSVSAFKINVKCVLGRMWDLYNGLVCGRCVAVVNTTL
jgi:hypothetical protein